MPPHPINAHIGNRLRERRMMLGLSQEALGNGIGVASQQVQKYEKGINVMNAVRMYEFACFLKVPVSYFYDNAAPAGKRDGFAGFEEEAAVFEGSIYPASDRETLEVTKSFKRIKDPVLRKRVADMLRTLSLKEV